MPTMPHVKNVIAAHTSPSIASFCLGAAIE
jgi:hypothetical protein